jgi:hypothetical protein
MIPKAGEFEAGADVVRTFMAQKIRPRTDLDVATDMAACRPISRWGGAH